LKAKSEEMVMVIQQEIGKILRALRQRNGLTQKELASKIQGKVDYSYIGKIERGEQLPSLKMLERLSNALAVPLSSFFQGLGSDVTARTVGREPDDEALGREREQLLLYLLHTVHNDDIRLLIEIVRVLNKRRKAHSLGKGEIERSG
jgi:transcriptional regulator with XRE-family HTH domain